MKYFKHNCSLLVLLLSLVFLPLNIQAVNNKPLMPQGIQIGDVTPNSAIIWSRSNQPARLLAGYADNPEFDSEIIVRGPAALDNSDFTARLDLTGLPEGRDIYLKVWFEGLTNARLQSEPVYGRFHTIGKHDSIRFVWGGDIAGQGWGINPGFGGMKIYEAMRQTQPHFFLESGDSVYSDAPIPESKTAENGRIWNNLVTPETGKVAETLDEFRGRYRYNLMDHNVRWFNSEVPQIWQWDDHEVVNNWSDAKDLAQDARYQVKDIPLLTAFAAKAFHEYAPLRPHDASEPERIYRNISFGPLLEVFVLDMRSYRGPNSSNLQTEASEQTAFLGAKQVSWLEQALKHSQAVWKVISADMPLGLNIGDGKNAQGQPIWEAVANGNDGPAAGRELEIARLLRFIKQHRIPHVVWLTADVHYAAAHYYDPGKAEFKEFLPFWEFVAGPLNAGSFGVVSTDKTFGPQVKFTKAPPEGKANLSPYAGFQFFGEVNIEHKNKTCTVSLKDINGTEVFQQRLYAK